MELARSSREGRVHRHGHYGRHSRGRGILGDEGEELRQERRQAPQEESRRLVPLVFRARIAHACNTKSYTRDSRIARRPAVRLLLINPRAPESFWTFRWAVDQVLPDKRAVNPPLGLATLAALCPKSWDVTIVDENVESIPLDPDVDLIGVCGMGVQFPRQAELLRHYRARGRYVVAGGSFASLCP